MLNPSDIAIVAGARTPMGRYCEKLRYFTAMELGAIAGRLGGGLRLGPGLADLVEVGGLGHRPIFAAPPRPWQPLSLDRVSSA